MSKTIDEKVVEMRFDNKQFESNVQTTLSTLDKLKAKLNLTGASKGLENISKESKKVNFSNMESSLAALEKRFSTTGIIGMTMIQNLTNSAMGFVKTLSNFSIGGILEGGKSRATKIENAQFQIKGLLRGMDDADKKLQAIMDNVNYGVQDTAYGLDAAASVAAQLVASGMEAGEGMKAALRGISGVAAMTNSSYEDIGRIYTTVAGNGRLMGDQLLQLSSRGMNAAATLAKHLGKSEKEIREMVSKGKIDFATFSEAMDKAFGEHAKDANKTLNGVLSNIRAALAKIGADFFQPIIAEQSPLVQFLNSVRYRINEIRNTISPITNEITSGINKFLTWLNKAFTDKNLFGYNPFASMIDKIREIENVLNKAGKTLNKVGKTAKDYNKVVDEIIMGKWKNAPTRWQELSKAGYNWAKAQNMVNKRLGNSVRHNEKLAEAQIKNKKSVSQLSVDIENLTEEQMRNLGFTQAQIDAFNKLKEVSEKTGIPIKKLMKLITQTTTVGDDKKEVSAFNTRYLILNSLKNIGVALISILKSVGQAFGEVFEVNPEALFDIIAALHKFTVLIKERVERNADKLTRTFKGLFAILHIISYVIGGAFKLALTIVNKVLGAFNLSILDITAIIGDAIFAFDRWITSNNTMVQLGKAFIEIIVAIIKCVATVIGRLLDWAKQNKTVMAIVNNITNAFNRLGDSIEAWTDGLRETDNIPKYIFEGLINGLKSGASKIFEIMTSIGKTLIEVFKNILGIHSPSVVFYAIGGFLIAGLVAGLKDQSIGLFDILKGIGNKIIDIFKSFSVGNIIAIGISAGILILANKIIGIVKDLTSVIVGFGDLLSGLGSMLTGFGKGVENFR